VLNEKGGKLITFFLFFKINLINSNILFTFAYHLILTLMNNTSRPLFEIANEISNDWKNVYFGAVPYLDAMKTLRSINDNYFYDSAKSVVLYFLANAQTWKGETARRVKAELKEMIK